MLQGINCICGGIKDRRAKQCKSCRIKEQKSTNNPRRRCPRCGGPKNKRGSICEECRRQADSERRAKRGQCECGNKKSEKATICVICSRKLLTSKTKTGMICSRCSGDKPLSEFYPCTHNEYRQPCKECQRQLGRKSHIMLKCQKYGLTLQEAEYIASLPHILCSICNNEAIKFHIDHCHQTGKFRGLLCSNCNSGIGLLKDDHIIVQSAANYLTKFKQTGTPIY